MQSVETRYLRTVKDCNKLDYTTPEDSKTNENTNSTHKIGQGVCTEYLIKIMPKTRATIQKRAYM